MGQDLTCKEFIAFLDEYLEGNQRAEVRAEFERHLTRCPPCRDYLKTYDATVRLSHAEASCAVRQDDADNPSHEDVPPELITAILAAIKKRQ